MKKNKKVSGITLVELLVAITISIIVFGLAISIYISVKTNYDKQKSVLNTNIKVSEIEELFMRAVNQAGIRCDHRLTQNVLIQNDTGEDIDFFGDNVSGPMPSIYAGQFAGTQGSTILKGSVLLEDKFDDTGKQIVYKYKPNTSFLVIQKDSNYTKAVRNSLNGSDLIWLDTSALNKLQPKDYVVTCRLNNYLMSEVLSVDNNSSTIVLQNRLSQGVFKDDFIGMYNLYIYYIADTGNKRANDENIYGLFLYIKRGQGLEQSYQLIDNVSDLQIYYNLKDSQNVWARVSSASDETVEKDYRDKWFNDVLDIKLKYTLDSKSLEKIISLATKDMRINNIGTSLKLDQDTAIKIKKKKLADNYEEGEAIPQELLQHYCPYSADIPSSPVKILQTKEHCYWFDSDGFPLASDYVHDIPNTNKCTYQGCAANANGNPICANGDTLDRYYDPTCDDE